MAISQINNNSLASGVPSASNITTGTLGKARLPTGSVLQVVNATTTTETSNSSSTYADTTLTASITPTSATSKILVLVSQNGCRKTTNETFLNLILLRDSSSIAEFGGQAGSTGNTTANNFGGVSVCYLDSPATTSSITYKTQLSSGANLASVRVQNNSCNSTITLMEIAA